MASFTPDYDDYNGSTSASEEGQAPGKSSPLFLADSAAPVFPINGEDLTEHVRRLEQAEVCTRSASSLFQSLPLDERHVFLCFKEPKSWPALVEAADFDRLPRSLAVTIKMKKNEMSKKTRLTVCEGRDGTDSSNGDLMLFPDMIRYKGLTHFDVDTFVDEVLVQNQIWIPGRPERLMGVHIFICSHARYDNRCGLSGPKIIGRLRNELQERGLDSNVVVRPCTHIGGHKYKANVILYSLDVKCYASVTVDDVCLVVDELFAMGVLVADQRRSFHGQTDSESSHSVYNSTQSLMESEEFFRTQDLIESYADMRALNPPRMSFSDKGDDHRWRPHRFCVYSWWQPSWWLKSWEREDTMAAFAVGGAAVSVYVAYLLYSIHLRR